jgi:hypothetical protein
MATPSAELGVHLHVFRHLVTALKVAGVTRSKHIALEEKLAIYLYASVTGLSIRHLGERFQHSNETISKCVEQHQFSLYLSDSLVFVRYFLSGDTGGISASDWPRPP